MNVVRTDEGRRLFFFFSSPILTHYSEDVDWFSLNTMICTFKLAIFNGYVKVENCLLLTRRLKILAVSEYKYIYIYISSITLLIGLVKSSDFLSLKLELNCSLLLYRHCIR